MQLNWITIGIVIVVILIGFSAYKAFKIWKTLKQTQLEGEENKLPKPAPKPAPAAAKPVMVPQPKLTPPQFFRKEESEEEEEEEEELDEEEILETEMFNLNEETEFDYKPDDELIIPLNINNIIQKVVTNKIEKPPSAVIEEIEDSEKKDLNRMTIIELKELAKQKNIKLSDGRKPKNKETLIKELSNV